LAGDGRKVNDRPRGFFFHSFFSSPSFILIPFVKAQDLLILHHFHVELIFGIENDFN